MAGTPKKNIQLNKPKTKQTKAVGKSTGSFKIPDWAPFAVIALTAIIYIRALYNGFASWDDDNYILHNDFIRDFSVQGFKAIFSSFYFANYHPLTTLTYWFEYSLFGLNALPYHLLNVLLHLLNVWLVYKLAEKLSGKKITALLVSLLFAIHPMHVESVAWISERKDVLYTAFYLLSLLMYLRFLKAENKTKFYFGTLIFFICSLLSKSAAVTLPIILIAIDFYKGRKFSMKMIVEKIPFLLLGILFGILAILSQQSTESISDLSLSYPIIDRIFLITSAVSFYIIKLFAPFGLSAMHYFPETHGGSLPWLYYASLPFLLILVWLLIRRSSYRKEILFGTGFFIIAISVMIQLIPVGFAVTAERYTYVAYIGLFYFIAQRITGLKKGQSKTIAVTAIIIFTAMFSYQSWNRIGVWKDGKTLFSDVIEKYPESFHAYWIRGNMKNNDEDLQGALADFNKSLECRPGFVFGLINRADVKNKLLDYKGALDDMNVAIKLKNDVSEAYNNRGMAYDGLGDTVNALKDYDKAILINPKLAKAYNNRGVLKANTGNTSGAQRDIDMSISLDKDNADAYSNRGNLKAMLKDFKGSIEDYNYSLKLKPKDKTVFYNRGISKLNINDTTGACEDWNKALQLGNDAASATIQHYCK
jgi:tetratricopeptide (TPR) repeat protein